MQVYETGPLKGLPCRAGHLRLVSPPIGDAMRASEAFLTTQRTLEALRRNPPHLSQRPGGMTRIERVAIPNCIGGTQHLYVPADIARQARNWNPDAHGEDAAAFLLRHAIAPWGTGPVYTHPGDPDLNDALEIPGLPRRDAAEEALLAESRTERQVEPRPFRSATPVIVILIACTLLYFAVRILGVGA